MGHSVTTAIDHSVTTVLSLLSNATNPLCVYREAALGDDDDEDHKSGDMSDVKQELAQKVRSRSKELGFFFMTQGKHIGGTQAGAVMLTTLFELLASKQLRLAAYIWGPGEGFMGAVVQEREKYPYLDQHYVTPLLAGVKTASFGFTEPPNHPRTTARLNTSARTLTINGVKSYVSGGDQTTFTCVLANVIPGEGGAAADAKFGSAMVIVDRETPGVRIERVFETISGHTAGNRSN